MKNFLFILLAVGMFTACQNSSGTKAVTESAKAVTKAAADVATRTVKLDPGSTINWTGKKLAGAHTGTLAISNGAVQVSNGKVTGGKITIDMNSLTCTDLKAGEGKEDLEGHLKSPDFFDVAKNPTATFEITSVTGGNVTGNLTMMGVTKSVTFPAKSIVNENMVAVKAPDFSINRTDWGLKYGSASFSDVVKDKAINDAITLNFAIKGS